MSALAEFVLARIADDEALALRARDNAGSFGVPDHVVRFSPDRILAECRAKRRRVEFLETMRPAGAVHFAPDAELVALLAATRSRLLKLEAMPHAEHPDFRDEWWPADVPRGQYGPTADYGEG